MNNDDEYDDTDDTNAQNDIDQDLLITITDHFIRERDATNSAVRNTTFMFYT